MLQNAANSVANQNLGVISNAVVTCNTMTGAAPAEAGSYGVRLIGFISNPTMTNNTIDGVDVGLEAEPRNGHITDMATAEENSFTDTGVLAVDWQATGALPPSGNWWGAASGPTDAGNPGGTGGAIARRRSGGLRAVARHRDDADPGPCFVPGDLDACNGVETCTAPGVCDAPDAPDGTACDDGMICTLADACTAGVCTGSSMTCGDGVLQAACGEECDDGNTTPGDGCDATCHTVFECTPAPVSGCRAPLGPTNLAFVRDQHLDAKDKLTWKWKKGGATTKAEFGSPTTVTDYLLCVYDAGTLVSRARIPADSTCAGRPCWRETSSGFKYKDNETSPDGIRNLSLKEGAAGKAVIILRGKGVNLDVPPLPMTQPVRVQLRNTDDVCWEAVYDTPAEKNTASQYKDKSE